MHTLGTPLILAKCVEKAIFMDESRLERPSSAPNLKGKTCWQRLFFATFFGVM